MNGQIMPGILSLTAICCLVILFLSAALSADIIQNPSYQTISGDVVPIYDAVQYQSQACVEKEGINDGMELYLKRPYGYVRSTADSQANLSIVKTYIERYSKSKSVIRGEIKNLDDKTIDLVVITFNLYNADGDQIGNAYASIDYLSPKTTWKFTTDPIERSDFQFERYGSIYIGVFE
jgi:hypothetical protein